MTPFTVLLRQIHPSFVQNGRPTRQAFRPTPKDENKLSMYDGDLIQPRQAWEHYTGALALQSAGVMGVAVQECVLIGLQVNPDPESFPEHCVIDFLDLPKNEIEKKAKRLAQCATARDWLFVSTV